ncbi:hypothetical protein POM88_033189 [Heracleum sosnowskyi]|uniref:Cleavage/polyadenylation specificity factor A subunit C-terminal domain-containing protein n=1 Tax=Heracleum sosnowskyi TaxID=360622 RepID=A0AAD8MKS9_9APIA|nr:hypothetical protein POM88_033189 [Heracleum sosnowskyi]
MTELSIKGNITLIQLFGEPRDLLVLVASDLVCFVGPSEMPNFDKISYLLCKLRDGHLLHFLLNQNNGLLTDRTKVSLGCQPISLCTFSSSNTPYIFAASKTPTVLYSSNEKLLYSSVVDLKEVRHLCPLNSAYFPDSLAFVEEDRLSIGTMDYPRFTIHSIPLEEEAVKVCHQDYSRTYALCCRKYIKSNGEEIGRVILLNDQTYEFELDYLLDQHEYGTSVISCSFADDSNVYYCIGTGYDDNNGHLIDKGRVFVLSAKDRKLQLIAEEQISKGVGSLDAFQESRRNVIVVAGASRKSLNLLTSFPFICIICIAFQQEKSAIEELYCHHRSLRFSTVTILEDEVYLGNDFGCDIFTVGKNSEGGCFEVVGKYHLGERVCRFCGGFLLMGMFGQIPTCIFGTDSGWIGIVACVPQNQYSFLFKLQSVLRKVIKYKGGLSHQKWIFNILAEEEVEDARNFLIF